MCVCLCLQLSFPLFYTRVCVFVGVIVLITLTPALGAGATVQGVDFDGSLLPSLPLSLSPYVRACVRVCVCARACERVEGIGFL